MDYYIYNKYKVKHYSLDSYIYYWYDNGMKKNGAKRGRPHKEVGELRTEDLLVKLKVDEKEAFRDAADLAGVSLSTWVRERLRRVAVNELQEASRPIAFLK
jgi:hypothetical protein